MNDRIGILKKSSSDLYFRIWNTEALFKLILLLALNFPCEIIKEIKIQLIIHKTEYFILPEIHLETLKNNTKWAQSEDEQVDQKIRIF